MKLNNEQIEKILNDAPGEATHRTAYCYLKNENGNSWFWYDKHNDNLAWESVSGKCDISEFDDYRSLDDLREILSLRKELEQTKKELEQVINEESDGVDGVV